VNVIRPRNNRVKKYAGIDVKKLTPINPQWWSSASIFPAPLDQNQTPPIVFAYPFDS
jgi:hypothetical protein